MKLVETLIGRTIDAAAQHSVQTLNDLTPSMIDDLSRLQSSTSAVNLYLSFHVVHYRGEYEDFIRDVVQGGQDPKTWGYRDVLVVVEEADESTCLQASWDAFVTRFEGIDGQRWCRFPNGPAVDENRDAWSATGSAIGVLASHVPYWWRCPRGRGLTTAIVGADLPVHLDDAAARIGLRRWIVRRMSWWARDYVNAQQAVTEAGILRALATDGPPISDDAEIALRALVRECALPYSPEQDIRGFMGPDAWYEG
jgi:hypothetical protein